MALLALGWMFTGSNRHLWSVSKTGLEDWEGGVLAPQSKKESGLEWLPGAQPAVCCAGFQRQPSESQRALLKRLH
jgi:hypothetical protein